MNEGLIQLLVVAAIIIFSVMDGAARKRRKEAQRLEHVPTPDGFPEAGDDLDPADESSERSEGMMPEDLWKEITALARGETPASQREQPTTRGPSSTDDPNSDLEAWTAPQQDVPTWTAPQQDVPTKTRSADLQGGYLHPDQAASHAEHAHEKHAEVASPPPPRPEELPHEFVPHPREQPRKPEKEPRRARPARSLLSGVRLGAKASLREAIVLAEVLSPPVTLRDSGWKPLF